MTQKLRSLIDRFRLLTHHGRWAWIFAAVGLLTTLGIFSPPPSSTDADDGTFPQAATPVSTWRLEQQSGYSRPLSFSGLVEGRRESNLGFERSGLLLEILVEEGAEVASGQLVARLDESLSRVLLQEAEAALVAATSRLEELESGPRAETVNQAELLVGELENESSFIELELGRVRQLLSRGAVSQTAVDEVATRFRTLEARKRSARSRLDELRAGTRPEQIEAQRAEVKGLRARQKRLRIELEKMRLVAPFDGHIVRRFADEGLVVAAGEPILQIVETTALEARIGVSARAADGLTPGSSVTLDIQGRTTEGVILSVSPVVEEQSRTVTVRVALDPGYARPGELVRLRVDDWVEEPGFWIPLQSLTQGRSGLWSCFEILEGQGPRRVQRHSVEILETSGEMAFVRGTLRDGDLVVGGGTHRLVPGQIVDPLAGSRQLSARSDSAEPTQR